MTDNKRYSEMFDYLSAPRAPQTPESTIVFGRKDPLVAKATGELILANLAPVVIISGGIGKDSGDILDLGYRSEAHYLETELAKDASLRGFQLPKVILDEAAASGGDNARNSLKLLNDNGFSTYAVTGVIHATSAKRLAETVKHEALKATGSAPDVFIKPTAYNFDASNPADQDEARAEMLRLADWPAKGWLQTQEDLPEDLVDFARNSKN